MARKHETGLNRRAVIPVQEDNDQVKHLRQLFAACQDYGVTEFSDGAVTVRMSGVVLVEQNGKPQTLDPRKPMIDPTDAMDLALSLSDASHSTDAGAGGKH